MTGNGPVAICGPNEKREWARLGWREIHAQLAGVRIEAPLRDHGSLSLACAFLPGGGGVEHVGDGGAFRHGEDQLGELALGRPDGCGMQAFDHAGRRCVELGELRVEDGLFPGHIPAARFPGDPDFVGWGKDQFGDGVFTDGLPVDGNGLGGDDVHVEVGQREIDLID